MAQRGRPRKSAITEQDIPVAEPQQEDAELAPRPSIANPRSGRKKRVPINGYRNVLSLEGQEPGWHYAFIRDDLVPRFESADYQFVTHDVVIGDRLINAASQVGSHISIPGGNGRVLYLMRQREEDYNEDMAAYHQQIDDDELAMFGNLTKEVGRYGTVTADVTKTFKGNRVY